MRYRALLIDLDGVIRYWPVPAPSVEAAFGLPPGLIAKIAFSPPLLMQAITGEITDAQWRERISLQLADDLGGAVAAEAVAAWSAPHGEVDRETLALVDRCRQHLSIVLVTNATSRLNSDLHALGLAECFDAVINSCEVGAAKPARRFYEAALTGIGFRAEQVLFIDDSQENVAAAFAMGMAAHRFASHAAMAEFLTTAGLLEPAP